MTERLHFHFSLSCIGEGNGNPLQCSFLENPGDRGAWWAAIYGVAQSWTWLKQLSSSSSSRTEVLEHKLSWFKCQRTGGPVVSPSNAGDVGLIPGKGTKISHAVGQLSPCTLSLWTTEPMHSRAPVHYKRKPTCFDVDPGRQKKKKKKKSEDQEEESRKRTQIFCSWPFFQF